MWRAQLDDMPEGWRGVAPDLRGFGQTPLNSDRDDIPSGRKIGSGVARSDEPVLTMRCFADDVARFIEDDSAGYGRRGNARPAVVVGLSMGGYVALELWRRRPDLVRALVLADTRAEADTDEARENRVRVAQLARSEGAEPIARAMLPSLLAPCNRDDGPDGVEARVRRMILATPPSTLIAALAGMASRKDSLATLDSIDVPTLVMVGQEDGITPPDAARTMADAIPDAELITVPDAGHLTPMERPEAFNQSLHTFLTRV